MLLSGKKLLITGVLTPQSIAYGIAELALQEGAQVLLTGFGRGLSITQRSAKRLSASLEVLELDVGNTEHFRALTKSVGERFGVVHGVLHGIAFAPEDALGGNFLNTPWESVQTAFRISTFSLKELAVSMMPLMKEGGSIVTLDFDNRIAWPIYDWMGVCKAGLEATVRYLARDLGPKGIPGFFSLERRWGVQAPLGWSAKRDHGAVARSACALLSDWLPSTTGEMIHVDGGYHSVGAAPIDLEEDRKAQQAASGSAE